jgi:hypothetical protein
MEKTEKSKKMTIKQLAEKIEKLENRILDLEVKNLELSEKIENIPSRDRGPKSTRPMTEDDAKRVIYGDLKDLDHKSAAKKLELSYGQIYSCRAGYTFRYIEKIK